MNWGTIGPRSRSVYRSLWSKTEIVEVDEDWNVDDTVVIQYRTLPNCVPQQCDFLG